MSELDFDDAEAFRRVCGPNDEHLRLLEARLAVQVHARGNTLRVEGEDASVDIVARTLAQLYELGQRDHRIYAPDIGRAVDIVSAGRRLDEVLGETILVTTSRRRIAPRNLAQRLYLDAMREHDLVFGVGPAGTGKTYLAMAMAVRALERQEVKRILLVRPAVEAGEHLGFLPGDMAEKVNPYLRPLYDALHDMLDRQKVGRLMSEGAIEIAPLAFMRGRTLNDCFVIHDEAQNSTREQMKMFLTRIGYGAKAVVTGDVTQTDLPDPQRSGLAHASAVLQGVRGVGHCEFVAEDVVRHPLVQRIVRAYERDDERRNAAS